VTHSTPDREDAARPQRWPLSKLRNSLKADDDNAKRKSPGLGRGRSGLLRDGTGSGAPGDFRPTSIQYISRGGDVTWITSFRFSLTVSMRVNSSKADTDDATLIEKVEFAAA